MAEFDEGENIAAFLGAFKGTFANPANTQARLKAERRAGQTPRQREQRSAPKKQVNFRANEQTRDRIRRLGQQLGVSTTAVLVLAINKLAEATPGFQSEP